MNQSDTAYFDYLLSLAVMDAAKASNPFTIPEPSITPYDPVVRYPTQSTSTSTFPDVMTFNFVDQMFDFNFISYTPTTPNDTSPHSRKKQENMVMFPEDIDIMTDSESMDIPALSLHLEPSRQPESEPVEFASKQKEVVPKKLRPRRAALGLSYSSFEKRLKILTEDPFVREIMADENKVHCAGCEKNIQLDNRKRRTLHLQNWKTHKRRCAGITQCRQYSLVFHTVSNAYIYLSVTKVCMICI